MKKLINDPGDVMRESLAGFAAAHSDILKVSFDPVYVVRADAPVTVYALDEGGELELRPGLTLARPAVLLLGTERAGLARALQDLADVTLARRRSSPGRHPRAA